MFPEKLKDLKWFIAKDLPYTNRKIPSYIPSPWCLVAFDVETTKGLYTFIFTQCSGLYINPQDYNNEAYISEDACCTMEKIGEINLPFDIEEHLIPKEGRVVMKDAFKHKE